MSHLIILAVMSQKPGHGQLSKSKETERPSVGGFSSDVGSSQSFFCHPSRAADGRVLPASFSLAVWTVL